MCLRCNLLVDKTRDTCARKWGTGCPGTKEDFVQATPQQIQLIVATMKDAGPRGENKGN